MIRVVLFDLDGVIRHFDARNTAMIERRYDLAPGDIERIAFARPLIDEVTTGRITRAEWVRRIGARVGTAAAEEWSAQPAAIDDGVLELIDDVLETGVRTAVLTNGTDTIPAEIAAHGIASRFDAVFNSAEIGYAKPDTRAFRHVLDALDVNTSPGRAWTSRRTEAEFAAEGFGAECPYASGEDRSALRRRCSSGYGRPASSVSLRPTTSNPRWT
ncbi:HAD family hydrolase [Microbacterium oxydans]|uniref:HAD family hydrolase n=1 Tax=Microbacterium oxydans TaxID=82380 RepID=UPI00366B64C9